MLRRKQLPLDTQLQLVLQKRPEAKLFLHPGCLCSTLCVETMVNMLHVDGCGAHNRQLHA